MSLRRIYAAGAIFNLFVYCLYPNWGSVIGAVAMLIAYQLRRHENL